MVTIIPTSAAFHLAKLLEKQEHVRVSYPGTNKDEKYYFPDGERYMKLPELPTATERVVVLHTGQPGPNEGLAELEIILAILKRNGIMPELFFSYFPYGMQDKVFEPGETSVAEDLLDKCTSFYGVQKVYALDAHFHGQGWVMKYPFVNVTAVPLLRAAAEREHPELIYLTPDAGSHRRTGISGTQKKRHHSFLTEIHADDTFKQAVKGKTVAVVDDLLETGGTLDRFYDTCREHGAEDVVALITHGVLASGIERITKKYPRLYLTNSIDRPQANVDIAPLVAQALKTNKLS